jgi:uncharacterized repeat protein (TIGR03803 family)
MKACGIFLLWGAAAASLPAQTTAGIPPVQATAAAPTVTFNTLHSFGYTDGAAPEGGLVQATNGDLYGTTINGGGPDDGTVFKISPSGTLTLLHTFTDSTDGGFPEAGLVQATNGNFYGTTGEGGTNNDGTVFKIGPSGTLTMLHTFDGTDGFRPRVLVQATNGNFYGTTYEGGINNLGTIFKITPSGTLTTLLSFDGTNGGYPDAGLVQAPNGDLYGTAAYGGANVYYGTVYKISPSGTLTTIYSFCSQTGCADGTEPEGELVLATDGNFYGTTYAGGAHDLGTVFKITPSGVLTTLHSFDETDGDQPADAGLVQATDGNFYGTTAFGGGQGTCFNGGCGTVFKITPSGTLTTLYSFCSQSNCTDGEEPYAGLIQDTNGKLYGTTFLGGADDDGTIFSLSVGLGPFVETQPALGTLGSAVKILGSNLTGATSVTFNGTTATFTVKSKSEITTTVPTGATTGIVKVVTPGGTLSSNVPFRVTQ